MNFFAIRLLVFASFAVPVMPMLAWPQAAAAAASNARYIESCDWNRPGHDPYTGDVSSAIDRYPDLPGDVRQRLHARMEKRDYDEVVTIERDRIVGKARYGTTIRDMHFGANKVCRTVSRSGWRPGMEEAGLVYCDSGQCILVPTICRNVSRITRAEISPDSAVGDLPPLAALTPDDKPASAIDKVAPIALLDSPPTFDGRTNPPDAGGEGSGGNPGNPGYPGYPGFPGPPGGGGGLYMPPGGTTHPPGPPPAVTPIPEPATWALLLAGIAATAAWRRRTPAADRA